MAVDKRHLRIARERQELIARGKLTPLLCTDLSVRLYEIDKDDRVVYRCLYCRSAYYPSESQWRDWDADIQRLSSV